MFGSSGRCGRGDVAGAGEDGEARISGKGGIVFGELAEEKNGAAVGLDFARVGAGAAEAGGIGAGLVRLQIHVNKHTQRGSREGKQIGRREFFKSRTKFGWIFCTFLRSQLPERAVELSRSQTFASTLR